MNFALRVEGGLSSEYVADLSPAQLRSEYRQLIRYRAARQREELHIQVSAAAATADGGKMAKSMDSALSDAAGQPTVRSQSAVKRSERQAAQEEAAVTASFDETAHLWR